ncbi:MAG TPA: hypothetical protein VF559_06220 [Caulobacteraceae bacterium]|jgi:hypothetical protein
MPHPHAHEGDPSSNLIHGSSGATADQAVEGRPGEDQRFAETLHAREADRCLDVEEKPDQLAHKVECAEDRQEALLDEGVEESFPASDPVSVKRIT